MNQSISTTALRAETCSGVVYAQVRGIVTLAGIEGVRRELAPVANDGASLVCLDYSRSALALTLQDMAVLAHVARPGASGLAMAWVVPDEATADIWRVQAFKFALVGLRRFVTTDPAEAHHWVALQSREAAALR